MSEPIPGSTPTPAPAEPRHALDAWILAQFAVAVLLAALSLLGVIATLAFDAVELTFTFQGAIQSFAIFPGLVISLVVNALLMRAHARRGAPVATTERILLGIEFGLAAVLLLCHFWNGPGGELFGLAILVWLVAIIVAITVGVFATAVLVRARNAAPGAATGP